MRRWSSAMLRAETTPGPFRCRATSCLVYRPKRMAQPGVRASRSAAIRSGDIATAYTRALVLAGPNAADVDEIVTERLRRQQVLARERPPFLLAVMDEM